MISWKSGLLQLRDWISYQKQHNPNLNIQGVEQRIEDMIFGLELEELAKSNDPADKELYWERIANGEIEWKTKV